MTQSQLINILQQPRADIALSSIDPGHTSQHYRIASMTVTSEQLRADLDALQSLPAATLARLIDTSAPSSVPPPPDLTTQLATFDRAAASDPNPTRSTTDASVQLSHAYVKDMRARAAQLNEETAAAGGIGSERDEEGARIGAIRDTAEQVKGAVGDYARLTKIGAAQEAADDELR